MIAAIAEKLLSFAVRLYTRATDESGVGLRSDGLFVVPEQRLTIDNGKRMIDVRLRYGPRWKEEE